VIIITLTVSVQFPVSGADRASDVLRTRVSITQLTLWSYCGRSNPVDPVALLIGFTRWRASCNGRCSDLLSGKNVCVVVGSPSRTGWAYTANVFLYTLAAAQGALLPDGNALFVRWFVWSFAFRRRQRVLDGYWHDCPAAQECGGCDRNVGCKCLTTPPFWVFWGFEPIKIVGRYQNSEKAHPWVRTRHLSHKQLKSSTGASCMGAIARKKV